MSPTFGEIETRQIADWILKDSLPQSLKDSLNPGPG